jgi:predicted dehydrogenase
LETELAALTGDIGLAQIGVGYWGKNIFRNLLSIPGAQLVAACDQSPDMLARVAGKNPDIITTGAVDDLLKDDRIDGIVISVPTDQHFELASAALRAGKHVFVEKPMTQSVKEAEVLVEIAEGEGLTLMVGHLLLYHAAFGYVRDLIREGALGEVYYLYSTRVNLGIVRSTENAFESLAPHDLAVALDLLNESPVAISAQGQPYLQDGIADVAFATVFFENGKIAHIHTSWLDPHKIRKVTLVGSRMMAVIDDMEDTEKVRLFDKGVDVHPDEPRFEDYTNAMRVRSGDIRIPRIQMKEPLSEEMKHFVGCIRTGSRPISDGRNGLAVIRIMDAAKRSMRDRGTCVEIS